MDSGVTGTTQQRLDRTFESGRVNTVAAIDGADELDGAVHTAAADSQVGEGDRDEISSVPHWDISSVGLEVVSRGGTPLQRLNSNCVSALPLPMGEGLSARARSGRPCAKG